MSLVRPDAQLADSLYMSGELLKVLASWGYNASAEIVTSFPYFYLF